jgi:N-methyl-L-tryptophan oxidase
MIYDLIVVGSGSVGAAAGYYATQAGLSVLLRAPTTAKAA